MKIEQIESTNNKHDDSLTLYEQLIVMQTGSNGGGKTSLIKSISDINPSGQTLETEAYNKINFRDSHEYQRLTGYYLQHNHVFKFLTALEYIKTMSKLRNLDQEFV